MNGNNKIKGLETMDKEILSSIKSHDRIISEQNPKFKHKWIRESETYIDHLRSSLKIQLIVFLIVQLFIFLSILISIILNGISDLSIGLISILIGIGSCVISVSTVDIIIYLFFEKFYHIGEGVVRVNRSRFSWIIHTDIFIDKILSIKEVKVDPYKNQISWKKRNNYFKNFNSSLYNPNVFLIKYFKTTIDHNPNKKLKTKMKIAYQPILFIDILMKNILDMKNYLR